MTVDQTIGIAGSGTMGNGIAHVCCTVRLQSGFVTMSSQEALDRGLAAISTNLDREVAKEKISMADKSASFAADLATTEIRLLARSRFRY